MQYYEPTSSKFRAQSIGTYQTLSGSLALYTRDSYQSPDLRTATRKNLAAQTFSIDYFAQIGNMLKLILLASDVATRKFQIVYFVHIVFLFNSTLR